ncbi:MAG: hypothetical protein ABEJ08_01730 [Halobacteriaceae archaeon]
MATEDTADPTTDGSRVATDYECTALLQNGDPERKADLLLVGKDYEDESVMRSDFEYFIDVAGEHRGLFAIPPFDENRDKFNVWMVNAGDDIGDWEDDRDGYGLVDDAQAIFEQFPFVDYGAVLAKAGMGRHAFCIGDDCWVKDVREKVEAGDGAAGFLHEWGHAFGGLKDEYYSEDGPDNSGPPNCASTREEAEEWWGDLADERDDVGFYRGCAYNEDNWRPHEQSIMGNGGLWSYGPVGERAMREELAQYD